MSGAIDTSECPRRNARGLPTKNCCCTPTCDACGYGPHAAVHGPKLGEEPGGEPYDHEYMPPDHRPEPTEGGESDE